MIIFHNCGFCDYRNDKHHCDIERPKCKTEDDAIRKVASQRERDREYDRQHKARKKALFQSEVKQMNLLSGLHKEIERNKEILKMYEAIPEGVFGAAMIKQDIECAERSIETGEIAEMITSLKALQETEQQTGEKEEKKQVSFNIFLNSILGHSCPFFLSSLSLRVSVANYYYGKTKLHSIQILSGYLEESLKSLS